MPYEIKRNGSKDKEWCVYNKDTGERKGCSATNAAAHAHMRALYAAEHDKTKAEESLQQRIDRIRSAFTASMGEVSSVWPVDIFESYLITKCWETETYWKVGYSDGEDGEIDIQGDDEWQQVELQYVAVEDNEYEKAVEDDKEDEDEDDEDDDDDEDEDEDEDDDEDDDEKEKSAIMHLRSDKGLKGALKRVLDWLGGEPTATPTAPEVYTRFLTKEQEDGQRRWIAISSTAFIDSHREIVSREGVDRGIAKAKEQGAGKLLFWHHPEVPLGTCDYQIRDGVCLIESGLWDDSAAARAAEKSIALNPEAWGISIGFLGHKASPAMVNGTEVSAVWTDLEFVERSVLPAKYAATQFSLIQTRDNGGITMQPGHADALTALVGTEVAAAVIASADTVNDKAKEEGAVVKTTSEVKPEAKPEAEPTALQKALEAITASMPEAAAVLKAALEAKPQPQPQAQPQPQPQPEATPTPEVGEILKALGAIKANVDSMRVDLDNLKNGEPPKLASIGPPASGTPVATEKEDQAPEVPKVVQDIARQMITITRS